MKILIIGGAGTIGRAVAKELSQRHTVIIAGRHQGSFIVDFTDTASIEKMYKSVGPIDAVIVAAGSSHFGPLSKMTAAHYEIGLKNKLMGQVNVVLVGLSYLSDAGSFTLTSGSAADDPYGGGTSTAMVNGAINSFVRAAAIEMPRSLRINVVSPTILTESMERHAQYFRGFDPVPAEKVALAYSKSAEGAQTGQVYRVGS
jgi:NAD(P)-dependent dehydrogenase (short-subunit alcohol dehydrogenase family)